MHSKIQLGDTVPIDKKSAKGRVKLPARPKPVPQVGLETNSHYTYNSETSFVNIATKVNVVNVKPEPRPVGVAKGAILADVPITVVENTAGATAHAMKKRCDHAPIKNPDREIMEKGHNLIMEKFDAQPTIQVTEQLVAEYLDNCTPLKAERLRTALSSPELHYDGNTKHVFAKAETLLKPAGSQPRVIYQGTDMYCALTGAVAMEITNRMKTIFSLKNPKNVGNRVIFACGMRNEEIGDLMEQSPGTALESDATNNDGTQSKAWRKYEAMFYAKLGAPKWFVQEFARNTAVRVWTRYGIAATVEGQRWSGESFTTTGNSYVHMCLVQVTHWDSGVVDSTNIHGGDDYLGVIPRAVDAVAERIPKTFESVGMEAKVVKPATRVHATFYRKRYVPGKQFTRGVPQFGRVLSKINLRANRNSQVDDRSYMAGKYLSAAYEHRFVPDVAEILLDTSKRLSDSPHLDERKAKLDEMGGVEGLHEKISSTQQLDCESFEGFLHEVYGISRSELRYAYQVVGESAIDWASKNTKVFKDGKVKTVSDGGITTLNSDVFKQLVSVDV